MAGTSPLESIPMSSPDISELEVKAVVSALKDGFKNPGLDCARFEESFKEYYKVRFAIGVNSRAAALHLCIKVSGIYSGDIVLTTPFSDIPSINAILYENAIPVFVDIDPISGAMNVDIVKQAVHDLVSSTKNSRKWLPRRGAERIGKLKALVPSNTFGIPMNMEELTGIAKEYNLNVIEDASEAFGARHLTHLAGTRGNFGVFSFHSGNQLSTNEGGMITTNNNSAANLIRALRNDGSDPKHQNRLYSYSGYSYQFNELNAALGRAQMTRIEDILFNRERVAQWYKLRLSRLSAIEIPSIPQEVTRVTWPAYVVRLDPAINRQNIIEELAIQGIPSSAYHLPIHLQPFMVDRFGYRTGDFPETELMARCVLALPFSGVMTEKQVDSICNSLKQILS